MRIIHNSRVDAVLESSCVAYTLRFSVRRLLALADTSHYFQPKKLT